MECFRFGQPLIGKFIKQDQYKDKNAEKNRGSGSF
jgi:hypothetical protein